MATNTPIIAATSLRALRSAHRPSFYDDPTLAESPTMCRACRHLLLLSFFLSLPTTMLLLARCYPALAALRWTSVVSAAQTVFPSGIELVLNGSQLLLRPAASAKAAGGASTGTGAADDDTYVCWTSGEGASSWCATAPLLEPIRLPLPTALFDAFHTDLPRPLRVPPARLLASLSRVTNVLDEDWVLNLGEALLGVGEESDFPAISEYDVGEAVLVRHGYGSLLWGGGWRPAVVEDVKPSRDMEHWVYTCRLTEEATGGDDGDDGAPPPPPPLSKRADHIRRAAPSIVLAHDDFFVADLHGSTAAGRLCVRSHARSAARSKQRAGSTPLATRAPRVRRHYAPRATTARPPFS
jgi:hypothetical protein